MNFAPTFRSFGLAMLVLSAALTSRAQSFEEATSIDFKARGYSNYDLYLAASIWSSQSYSVATAQVSFGGEPLMASSSGYTSTAATLRINNIHQLYDDVWIADSVEISEWNYGWQNNQVLYDVAVPSIGTAMGEGRSDGMIVPLWGTLTGWGDPLPNNPPEPSVNVVGLSSGTGVSVNLRVALEFSASDAERNLTGITYHIYNSTTGLYVQTLVGQSPGPSQVVTTSYTLSTAGEWYFWTEAVDATGATASTPSGTNGFHLSVSSGRLYCTPAFEPAFWNSDSFVQAKNNCYNYANNRRTNTFAQPGLGSGTWSPSLSAANLVLRATSDGLEPTTRYAASPSGKTKVALVIWPGQDYHWYRLDNNGRWTHKRGVSPATHLDNSGWIIYNPEWANRGPYTEFVGYFFTPSDCGQGQGLANIR